MSTAESLQPGDYDKGQELDIRLLEYSQYHVYQELSPTTLLLEKSNGELSLWEKSSEWPGDCLLIEGHKWRFVRKVTEKQTRFRNGLM